MRHGWFRFASLLALLFPVLTLAQSPLQKQIVPLNSGWEFRQLSGGAATENPVWRPAQVPGSVHLDLLHNNLIPDPFYRDN
jgi:beta-mannosidase